MTIYSNILKQAWQITRRYKFLWFFGVFAALLGNGGEYEILMRFNNSDAGAGLFPVWQRAMETGFLSKNIFANIGRLFVEDTLSMIFILLLFLIIVAIFIFLVWLAVISQTALVDGAAAAIAKKKYDFRDGMDMGIKRFWPVFSLNILVKAAIYIVFVLLGLPVVFSLAQGASLTASFIYIISFIIFIPLALVIAFIAKYAVAYCVIRGQKFNQALSHAWQLFKANWLVSFIMAVILFLINLLISLAVILSILILLIPFLFLGYVFFYIASLVGFWLVVGLAFIFFLGLIILAGSLVAVFQTSSWTLLFLELERKNSVGKIVNKVMGNF